MGEQRGPMRLVATIVAFAGVNGAIAVAVGAVAAHVAGPNWEPRAGELLRMGADYQLVHALALLGLAAWLPRTAGWSRLLATLAAVGFAAGICGFCLSLYWAAVGGRPFLAPFGGSLLIAAWLAVGMSGAVAWFAGLRADD